MGITGLGACLNKQGVWMNWSNFVLKVRSCLVGDVVASSRSEVGGDAVIQ